MESKNGQTIRGGMMDESQHSEHKIGMGKIYEKYLMTKRLVEMLDIAYAFNTETERTEVVLVVKEGERTIPLGTLWSAEDFQLRQVNLIDSEIISKVFKLYEVEGKPFAFSDCEKIYQKFLNVEDVAHVRDAGTQIQTSIQDMNAVVADVKQTTEQYNEKLTDASEKLNNDNLTFELGLRFSTFGKVVINNLQL